MLLSLAISGTVIQKEVDCRPLPLRHRQTPKSTRRQAIHCIADHLCLVYLSKIWRFSTEKALLNFMSVLSDKDKDRKRALTDQHSEPIFLIYFQPAQTSMAAVPSFGRLKRPTASGHSIILQS